MISKMNWNHLFPLFLVFAVFITQGSCNFTCNVPDKILRSRSFDSWNKWPNATVKYELHSSLSSEDIRQVHIALNEYNTKTCIRFIEKGTNDKAFVSIMVDNSVCGIASMCYTGGRNEAKFGGVCRTAHTMVHELGHTLCFGHEQDREDRDDYIYYKDECEDMSQWKGTLPEYLSLYDYTSAMHYQCVWCPGGWPKMNPNIRCGGDVNPGLSLLDAEKFNLFYDCEGCFSHRWRPISNLTNGDMNSLIPGGKFYEQLYICRAYHTNGDILIGDGSLWYSKCYFGFSESEYQTTKFELLTNPKGVNYIWQKLAMDTIPVNAVPAGRTAKNEELYVGRCTVSISGSTKLSTGYIHASNPSVLIVSFHEVKIECRDFEILVCNS